MLLNHSNQIQVFLLNAECEKHGDYAQVRHSYQATHREPVALMQDNVD